MKVTDMTTPAHDKLRKLLALAHSQTNQHEAANAFAHAQRIATLHGLDLDDLGDDENDDLSGQVAEDWRPEDVTEIELDTWGKAVAWKVRLSSHLERANNCKGYRSKSRLVAYGQPADLHTVAIMYREICAAVNALAREAVRDYTGSKRRSFGRSFRLGAVAAIGRRLVSQRDTVESLRSSTADDNYQALAKITTAIARVDVVAQSLDAYAEANLSLRKGQGFTSAGRGFARGLKAGESIGLNKPAPGLS